jgi:hypothetical protein
MKNISQKIWWFVVAYLAAGYVFVSLYRLRFILIIIFIILVLTLKELEAKFRWYGIIGLLVLTLFFFKIIPSPYLYFKVHHLEMSLSVALTILVVFLSVVAGELIFYFSTRKKK